MFYLISKIDASILKLSWSQTIDLQLHHYHMNMCTITIL
ncbi:protein of unknown function [Candidatus Nitrosocosmicus franklandus]|uniref:Uncharacterized protein n=1 Tax=Candidatus Nitrosocosmicus franklandianus TaxID=1798806 RepID=A0A484ICA9_9ARCH|nr:protein of unknown function [Candidatus Nitrosocosmicus franklandus]